jgi:glycine cleavage system transcriptional repressor
MTNQGGGEYLAITASGEDRIGLVDKFTARINDSGCNIEDSRMAVLGGQFAIIMLLSGPWNALSKLESQLADLGEQLGLAVVHKRTRAREQGKSLIPYHVEVVSMDHPGIVHKLASFFAARAINIEEMDTDTYPAPHTGTPMFKVNMTIGIPGETHIPTLRGDFLDYCDDLNLDALFEPARS